MMLSLRSCSADVMNRFTPEMSQEPSSCCTALVRPAPTSEPASGSVSTIVAPQPFSIMISARRFWSALPRWCSVAPNVGPEPYMKTAGLAPRIISKAAQRKLNGAPKPPSSSGTSRRHHSPALMASTDFLNDSGRVTGGGAGANTGGGGGGGGGGTGGGAP